MTSDPNNSSEPRIKGLLAFFLFFWIPMGAIASFVASIIRFKNGIQSGNLLLMMGDIAYLLFYLFFCIYTIYAFIKRRPDAVFSAKSLLIYLSVSNLFVFLMGGGTGYLSSLSRCGGTLMMAAIIFYYLCASKDVNEFIPVETRKVGDSFKIVLLLSVILPVILYLGGAAESTVGELFSGSVEERIQKMCEIQSEELPKDFDNGTRLVDMRLEGEKVVYEYELTLNSKSDYSEEQIRLLKTHNQEIIRNNLGSVMRSDSMAPLLVKAGYEIEWQYCDNAGEYLYSIVMPSEIVASGLKNDYSYKTPRDTFEEILSMFSSNLPYGFFDDCTVTGISLSDDGNTLIYELNVVVEDSSSLNDMSTGFIKSYMRKILPKIQDIPFQLAKANGLDVSFVFHAAGHDRWERTATFTEKDYNAK